MELETKIKEEGNERADALATAATEKAKKGVI